MRTGHLYFNERRENIQTTPCFELMHWDVPSLCGKIFLWHMDTFEGVFGVVGAVSAHLAFKFLTSDGILIINSFRPKIKQANFKIPPFRRNSIFRAQMKVIGQRYQQLSRH